MKVKILRPTVANGGESFDPGDTPDLSPMDARILIADGAAIAIDAPETASIAPAETAAHPPAAPKKPAK